ncbi:MAG TPA: poly-gamma-glutamate hydrolase family protein [Syntrophobacteria bacterium]|nr:poly-gamma-glutamate hydrolase family protein [Syntrophobacteria bacterium]
MAPKRTGKPTPVSSGPAAGASEFLHLAGPVGILALHGGGIEPGTETIARFVAGETGASLYIYAGRLQRGNLRLHRPSPSGDSELTPVLRSFLDHVQLAISIHGHGRAEESVFLGGLNDALAVRLAEVARAALPRYGWISDPMAIPPGLRGQHPRNAVNLPPDRGVQIELPRSLREIRTGSEGRALEPSGDTLVFAQVLCRIVHDARTASGQRS